MSNSQQGPPRRSLLDTVAALAREQQQQKLQAQQQRSLTAGLAAPLVNPSPTPPSVQSAQASLSAPAQGGSGSGPLPTLAQRPLVGLTGLDLSSGHSEPPGPSLPSRLLRPSTSGSIGSPSTSLLGTGKRKLQGVLDLGSASSDLRVSNEGYLGQGAGAPAGLSHEQLLHRQQLALLEARQQQQQQLLQLQGLPASSQRPLPLSLQQQPQQQQALGDPGGAAGPTAPARSALLTTLLLQQQQQQSLSGTSGRQPSGDRMDLGGAPGSYSPARPRSGGLGVSQQQGWPGASSRQPSGERLDLGAGLGPYGPGSVQLRGVGLAGQQQQGWTGASSRQPSGERLDLGAGPGPYGPGMLLDRRSPVIGEGRMGSQSSLDDAIGRSCSVSGASAAHLKSGDLGSTSGALPGLRATLGAAAGSAQPSPQQRVGLQHSSNDGGLVAAGRGQQGQPLALQDTILAPSLLHGRSHSQGGLSQAQQQLQQLQQYHQQQLLLLQRQQLRLAQEAAEAGPSGPALALDAAGVAGGSMTSSLSGAARPGRPLSSGSVPTADGRPPSGGLGLGAGLGGAPAVQLQRVSDAAVDGRPSSSSSRLFKVCETRAYDEIDLLLQDIDLLHVAQSGWGPVGSTGHQQQQQQQLQQQLQQQREQEELHGGEGPSKFSRHSEDSGISMRRYHSSPLPTEDKMTALNLQQQLRVSQAAQQQQQQQQALQGSGTQQQQPGLQDPEVYRQRLLALHRHHQEQLQQKQQQQQQQLQGGPMAPFAHPHGATAAASEPLDAPRTGLPSGTASSVSSGLQLQQQVGPRAAAVQSEPLPAVGIDRHHPPRYSSFSQRQQQQQLQLQQYQHPDPPHLPYVPYQPYGQQEQQQQQTWKPPDKEAFTAAAAAAAARGEYVEWLSGQQLGMSAGQRGREPSGSGLLAGSGPLQLGMSSGFRSAGNSSKLLGGELASGIGAGISGGLQQQQHQQQSPGFYATEVPSWRSATDAPGVQLPRGVQQGQSGAAAALPLQQQQQQLQLQPQEALQQQQASLQVQQQALGQPQMNQAGAAYPAGPPGGVEPTPGLNLNGGHVGAERAHDKELVPPMLDPDMCGELFDLPGVSGDDLGGVDELMREILSSNDAMDADAGTPNTQLAPGLGHVQGEGQGQAHGLGQGQGQPQSVVASGPNQTPPPHDAQGGQGQGQPQSVVASGANQPPPAKYARYNPNGTQQLQQQELGKPPPLQQQLNMQQQLVQQQHMQQQLAPQENAPEPGRASASNARSPLGTWAPPAPLLPQRSGNFLVPSPVLQQQQHPLPVLHPTRVYPSGSGQSASRLSRQSYGRSSGSMQKSTSGAAGGSSASANVDATAAAGSGTGPRALTPRAVAAVESAGPSGPPGWPSWPHGRVRGMSSGSVGGSGVVGRGGVAGCRPDSGQTTRNISSMGTGTLGTPRGAGDGRAGDVDIEAAGAAANGSGGTPPNGSGGTPASASRGGASTRGSSRGNSGSKPRVYNRTVPTFGDIVSHGLFPVGEAMWTVGNIKDEVAVEITQTGEIVYEGAKYSSISAFALVVLRQRNSDRQACDGWREVRYGGVKMEVLRKECLRIMFENGEL